MVTDSAFVAGSRECAAGFFPAVTVYFQQLPRGEDMFFGEESLQQRAAVYLFPLPLEFDRTWRLSCPFFAALYGWRE